MSIAVTFLAASALAASPTLVLHDGTVLPSSIQWETTIVHDLPVEGPGRVRIELAVPLPPDTVAGFGDTTLIRDAHGAVTALESSPVSGPGRSGDAGARVVVYRVRQPLAAGASQGDFIRLAAPLIATQGIPQGVALGGEAGARFTPDARLGIEHRVGRLATHGLGYEELNDLEAAERNLGRKPAPWRCWLEVDTALLDAGGLVGTLETGRPRRGVVLVTALGFAGTVALLGAGVRGLARMARRERDDALLEQELKDMRRSAAK